MAIDDIKNISLSDVSPITGDEKKHIAKAIQEDYADEYDFSGLSPDQIIEGHRKKFGADLASEAYDAKLKKVYLADYHPNHPVQHALKEMAIGSIPFVISGAAHAIKPIASKVPLASQIGAGLGHGLNLVLNAGQAAQTAEKAREITDIDPIALRNDYYHKLYPGLSEKGWSDEDILQVAKERAINVLNGAYQTATSMNRAEEVNFGNEIAASAADLAAFGWDGRIGRNIIGQAMKRFGLDEAARTTAAKAIVGPIVQHATSGAAFGGTDLGLRTLVGGKAQTELMQAHGGQMATTAEDISKHLVRDTALATGLGMTFGGAFGGAMGAIEAARTAPMTIHELQVSRAWEEANAQNRAFENQRAANLAADIESTAKNFNPMRAEVPQGASPGDIATSIIEKSHGTDAANSEAGLRAATVIERKLRLYNDANEEMARAAGSGIGGDVTTSFRQPEGSTGNIIGMSPEAAPSSGLVPAGPMPERAPVAGPVLGGIETGGQLPPALSPQGEFVLPGRAPLAPVRPLPPETPPSAGIRPEATPAGLGGGEAPIMRLEQPRGGEPMAFGERNLPAPPSEAAPPTTEQLAEGWSKELGFQPKKTRAKPEPKVKAEKEREVNPLAQNVVESYRAEHGFKDRPGRQMHPPLDKEQATAIAQEYEALKNAKPGTPEYEKAEASYKALNAEIAQQFEAIKKAGYKIEFVEKDPYKNSAEMRRDVRENKTLKVFKTPEGHHPFMTTNESDLFRAVHDFFGHAAEGFEFGPRGEESAFRQHAATLSNNAIPALASETRGQNSWVNFMPENAKLPAAERPFAEQKGSLMPEHTYSDVLHGERVPVETKPEGIHIGVPIGDATAADVHAALNEAVSHADRAGIPITAELTRIDVPKGGRIPVEKQFEKFYEPRGFKMTELTRSPEGQIQTARLRRDAVKPPKGGMLEAQGTMYERIAQKADEISKAAADRLEKKLGRMNVGFDPSMIGDAALELTGAMFAKGVRGAEAMGKYLVEKYGNEVKPFIQKIVDVAGKHFTRFFKSDGQAVKGLQDLLDLYESGKHGADWYEKTAEWAKKNAGHESDMLLRFLAVTSANGQTESGAALALKAFAQWKAGLKFTGMRGPSMVGQLERIANGENLGDLTKIENFYRALKGDPNAVVLDRWMLRAMGIRNQSALSPSNYRLYEAGVRHLAELNDMSPRQLQAAIWAGARTAHMHETEAAGGRRLSSKTGSARPLEDLIERKLDGMTFDQYVGKEGEHLKRMENIYKALEPVRKGDAVGHTFNLDTMEPDTKPGYVVSLVSTNVPKSVLYPARIDRVLYRVQPLIEHLKAQGMHPTLGVFASELHPGQFSIDLNVTLPSEARAQAIATANRQESFAHLGEGGQWIENITSQWNRKGKQYLPPNDGRLHREWYTGQINRVKNILKENP
jgi:hypothetical protein